MCSTNGVPWPVLTVPPGPGQVLFTSDFSTGLSAIPSTDDSGVGLQPCTGYGSFGPVYGSSGPPRSVVSSGFSTTSLISEDGVVLTFPSARFRDHSVSRRILGVKDVVVSTPRIVTILVSSSRRRWSFMTS